MSQHFNIQINVQQVDVEPVKVARSIDQAVSGKDRSTISIMELKVSAPTLQEAYAKVSRLVQMEQAAAHLHRASCDDSGGNLTCGFPPGPSIGG